MALVIRPVRRLLVFRVRTQGSRLKATWSKSNQTRVWNYLDTWPRWRALPVKTALTSLNNPIPRNISTYPNLSTNVAQMSPRATTDEHRLPLDVKPTHYDLTIATDLEKLVFTGSVKIDLDILNETSTIVFNSSSLNLHDILIYSEELQAEQRPTTQSFNAESERTTLQFLVAFPAGSKAQLSIAFHAALTGNMMGYYASTWEQGGEKKYYTLTQFEPTAARRSFPCWDEPLLKATYTINLISRADTVNLSNMPAMSEEAYDTANDSEKSGEWKITRFERTPPVSSYLVAFANGHFDFLESSYTSPLSGKTRPLRIYATSDIIHQAQFALDVKKMVLPLYEQLFNVEFPLPKLDTLIASDFDSGAMENWGLITGRTSVFLMDPQKIGVATQKRVASVQSHEVAHMWFGNITTMAWWDNLYLNEGFATLMGEVIILDKLFPEWKLYSGFITVHLNDALDLDAKLSSHPVEVECPDANQINQIFDALSYSKAASVLRMLSTFVGEDRFLQGVSIYLKKHLYANSVTKDLWNGISEATGIDVAAMMENWVSKIGFPMLTVTETSNGIHVRQDRFLETGPAAAEDNQTIWHVPLNIVQTGPDGKAKVDNTFLLKERETTIVLDTSKPFKLNADTTSVCRVLYSPERLRTIASEAAKGETVFSLNDRIGLVHDAFALARAGFAKVSDALNLAQAFRHEEEFLVWQGMGEKVGGLAQVWWEDDNARELFMAFRREIYGPLVEKLGFQYEDSDSADTKQLRTLAISGAANVEDQKVIKELTSRFNEYQKTGDDSGIPLDLERITYSSAVKYGGREQYDIMQKIYAKPRTPTTRSAAVAGMCATRDQDQIGETFKFILTEAREQDFYLFFFFLSLNTATRRQMADFTKSNYDEIYKRFSGNTQLSRLISLSFERLSTDKDANDIEEFFKDKDVSKFNLALSQTLDTIRANSALLKHSSEDVMQWLENWSKASKL